MAPVITIEAIEIFWRVLFEGWNGRTVGEEYVGEAVIVVVEGSYATGHGFDDVLAGSRIMLQNEVKSSLLCNFLKANGAPAEGRRYLGSSLSSTVAENKRKKWLGNLYG